MLAVPTRPTVLKFVRMLSQNASRSGYWSRPANARPRPKSRVNRTINQKAQSKSLGQNLRRARSLRNLLCAFVGHDRWCRADRLPANGLSAQRARSAPGAKSRKRTSFVLRSILRLQSFCGSRCTCAPKNLFLLSDFSFLAFTSCLKSVVQTRSNVRKESSFFWELGQLAFLVPSSHCERFVSGTLAAAPTISRSTPLQAQRFR